MKSLSTSLAASFLFLAGPALADDDCAVPMADWKPRAAVEALARDNGWKVTRIRLDDGCYELDGQDAQGRWIEVKLDPASLRVVEMEVESEGSSSADGNDD